MSTTQVGVMDEEAYTWACSTLNTPLCRCNREIPRKEFAAKEDFAFIESLESECKANGQSIPSLFVMWNPRCPLHGFPKGSAEYDMGAAESETKDMEPKWYARWREQLDQQLPKLRPGDVGYFRRFPYDVVFPDKKSCEDWCDEKTKDSVDSGGNRVAFTRSAVTDPDGNIVGWVILQEHWHPPAPKIG